MQDYDIRPAAPSDMDAILSFQRAAIAAVPEAFYSRTARDAWMRTPAVGLAELIAKGRYYVAAKQANLVAGGGWQPSDKEPGAALIRGVFVVAGGVLVSSRADQTQAFLLPGFGVDLGARPQPLKIKAWGAARVDDALARTRLP